MIIYEGICICAGLEQGLQTEQDPGLGGFASVLGKTVMGEEEDSFVTRNGQGASIAVACHSWCGVCSRVPLLQQLMHLGEFRP